MKTQAIQAAVQQQAAQASNDIARLEGKVVALEDENRRLKAQSGAMGVSTASVGARERGMSHCMLISRVMRPDHVRHMSRATSVP